MKISTIKLLVLVTLFFSTNVYSEELCNPPKANNEYSQFIKDRDKKIEELANKKEVASQADAMLSKLISAKSPVIMNWLSKRDFEKKTEIEIAKEWRSYFLQNILLSNYPQKDDKINTLIEDLVDSLTSKYLNPKKQKHFQRSFDIAKTTSIKTIKSFKDLKANEIISRIESAKLYFPTSFKKSKNNSNPLEILKWGIAYDPVQNEINIGLESLGYSDENTLFAVFSHEFGHAFDSCRWGAYFQGDWPFQKVGDCLRETKSAHALKRDDSKLKTLIEKGEISKELGESLVQNPTCNKTVYPPYGVQADQLPETFADWFAAEVLAQADKKYQKNIRLDLCTDSALLT